MIAAVILALVIGVSGSQPASPACLHHLDEAPDQQLRRQQALGAARAVNTTQFAHRRRAKAFLPHAELAAATPAAASSARATYDFTPGAEVLPGWQLTLHATQSAYWFMIRDKTDPCGFAYISNHDAVIYTAQPIR